MTLGSGRTRTPEAARSPSSTTDKHTLPMHVRKALGAYVAGKLDERQKAAVGSLLCQSARARMFVNQLQKRRRSLPPRAPSRWAGQRRRSGLSMGFMVVVVGILATALCVAALVRNTWHQRAQKRIDPVASIAIENKTDETPAVEPVLPEFEPM